MRPPATARTLWARPSGNSARSDVLARPRTASDPEQAEADEQHERRAGPRALDGARASTPAALSGPGSARGPAAAAAPPVPVCDPGRWHAVSHAAPVAFAEPSSHCSPRSSTPSPQLAFTQVVRQAAGVASLLLGPSSHASPGSTTPSPQLALTQVVRQAPGAVSLLFAPLSHCSPVSTLPSPQCDRVQFVLQAPGTMSLLLAPSSQSSPGSSVSVAAERGPADVAASAPPPSGVVAHDVRVVRLLDEVGPRQRIPVRHRRAREDRVARVHVHPPWASAPTRRVLSASSDDAVPCASRAASSSLTPTTGTLTGNMAAWVRGSSRLDGGASPTASEKIIPMAPP